MMMRRNDHAAKKGMRSVGCNIFITTTLLVFAGGVSLASGMCSGNLRMDWKVSEELFALTCMIEQVNHRIFIKDQHGLTQGYCLPPYPSNYCATKYKNSSLSLTYDPNIAMFEMRGKIDSSINGNWTCQHGLGFQSAQCYVDVSKFEALKTTTPKITGGTTRRDVDHAIIGSVTIICCTLMIIVMCIVYWLYFRKRKKRFKYLDRNVNRLSNQRAKERSIKITIEDDENAVYSLESDNLLQIAQKSCYTDNDGANSSLETDKLLQNSDEQRDDKNDLINESDTNRTLDEIGNETSHPINEIDKMLTIDNADEDNNSLDSSENLRLSILNKLNLDDNQIRWVLFGFYIRTTLTPALQKYVKPYLEELWKSLKLSHSIDQQQYPKQLMSYPLVRRLNYEAINSNKKLHGIQYNNNTKQMNPNYDYRVINPVDLSKLFIHTHMANYTALDDGCDSSALLAMIINLQVFRKTIKDAAKLVRKRVLNPWMHDLTGWNDKKFNHAITITKNLAKLCMLSKHEDLCMPEWMIENANKANNSSDSSEMLRQKMINQLILDDNQIRWTVFGFHINTILTPALQKYVEPYLEELWESLKVSDFIDQQQYPNQLMYDYSSKRRLNYESINSNRKKHGKQYNNHSKQINPNYEYRVLNPVDLSKLFLPSHMANYTAFDDGCHSSALLAMIINIYVFPKTVKEAARKVRANVLYPWRHDLTGWNDKKLNHAITITKNLAKLCMSTKDEDQLMPKWMIGIRDLKGPYCDPCKFRGLERLAKKYCKDCKDKRYCGECSNNHTSKGQTNDHILIELDPRESFHQRKPCDTCQFLGKSNHSVYRCNNCEEYLCEECKDFYTAKTRTNNHAITNIYAENGMNCDVCLEAGKNSTAEFYCVDCENYDALCLSCSRQHNALTMYMNHKMSRDLSNLTLLQQKLKETKSAGMELPNESEIIKVNTEIIKVNTEIIKVNTETKTQDKEELSKTFLENRPSKPYVVSPNSNYVTLHWSGVELEDNEEFQIMFKEVQRKNWLEYRDSTIINMIDIKGLKPNTNYVFRVRKINYIECVEGAFSEESDVVQTWESTAREIVKISRKVLETPIDIYALPLTEDKEARNQQTKTRKLYFGNPDATIREKNILIVGATGSGKSTLINVMTNYIMGVEWEDPFRFTLIDKETDMEDEACSQTTWVTCYTIPNSARTTLPFTVNLIDTPGFGDTRGLEHDQYIVKQIKYLFSSDEKQGVSIIDAVCFIVQAPVARLTTTQKYIFETVLSLFGKDIKENICTLVTFADGQRPPVLASLESLEHKILPYNTYFAFNSSGFFVSNKDANSYAHLFWKMGMRSCENFFDYLKSLQPKSLSLTNEVLIEREALENSIEHLYQEIDVGLSKIESLEREIELFKNTKRAIMNNRDFEYELIEKNQKHFDISATGVSTTYCLSCNFSCHERCTFVNDIDKIRCCAMGSDGNCTECPGKCHWGQHKNTPYIIKLIDLKVKKKYSEKKQIYETAMKKTLTHEQVLAAMADDIVLLEACITDRMERISRSKNRLKEIALRPNPLSATEYIELMINSVKLEKKKGFETKIDILMKIKQKAEYGNSVSIFQDRLQSAKQDLEQSTTFEDERSPSLLERFKNGIKSVFNIKT